MTTCSATTWISWRTRRRCCFGRTTYQIWAAFWPSLPDDEPFGRRTNEIQKYVVSNTLTNATWTNTTIIRGDLATEIRALKDRIDGDILCYGSADLVGGLMDADLVDEYRLMLFPIVLGSGKRLFRDEADTAIFGSSAPGRSGPERSTWSTSRNGIRPPASTRTPTHGRRNRSSRSMPRRTPTGCSRP